MHLWIEGNLFQFPKEKNFKILYIDVKTQLGWVYFKWNYLRNYNHSLSSQGEKTQVTRSPTGAPLDRVEICSIPKTEKFKILYIDVKMLLGWVYF